MTEEERRIGVAFQFAVLQSTVEDHELVPLVLLAAHLNGDPAILPCGPTVSPRAVLTRLKEAADLLEEKLHAEAKAEHN